MATDGQTMAEQGLALPRHGFGRAVSSPLRLVRGACPSLASPMQTGDGLLVRLRPSTPGLTMSQFRWLAEAAIRHGNGLIEVTARGNLQLRGLSPEAMPGLEADLASAGIVPETGLTIETPPLSGLDPSELADGRALAARLREAVAGLAAPLKLAPKLTIVIDSGGLASLDALTADIRLQAIPVSEGKPQWLIGLGGTRATASPLSVATDEQAIGVVVDLLKTLDALGPRARGCDLAPARWPKVDPTLCGSMERPASHVGLHRLGVGKAALGLQLAYGQVHADDLIAFLDRAEAEGAMEVRTAPGHALLVIAPALDPLARLQPGAAAFGFWIDADTPARNIATCAGAGGCASASYRTKELAARVAAWVPDLLDGSMVLHLSGCPKGCAHPGAAAVALVGVPDGFGLVLGGKASDAPAVVVDEIVLEQTLRRIANRVAGAKAAGESAGDCLTRLGSDAIVAALRQE